MMVNWIVTRYLTNAMVQLPYPASKSLPVTAGKTKKGCTFFWGNIENIRELFHHLGGWAAFFRLEFAQGAGRAMDLLSKLFLGPALAPRRRLSHSPNDTSANVFLHNIVSILCH